MSLIRTCEYFTGNPKSWRGKGGENKYMEMPYRANTLFPQSHEMSTLGMPETTMSVNSLSRREEREKFSTGSFSFHVSLGQGLLHEALTPFHKVLTHIPNSH